MHTLPNVLAQEIARDVFGKALLDAEEGGAGAEEGFVVAGVGDDDVGGGEVGQGGGFQQELLQKRGVGAVFGGDVDALGREGGECVLPGGKLFGGKQVGFVENQDRLLAFRFRENGAR